MKTEYTKITKEDYIKAKTDEKTFEKVFRANIRLVGYCEKKYCALFTEKFNQGEYENALEFGLYKAIMMFDPNRNNFSTYAIPVMLNEVKMLNRNNNSKTMQNFSKCFSLDEAVVINSKDGDSMLFEDILSDGTYEQAQESLLEEFPDVQRLYSVIPDSLQEVLERLSVGEPQWKIALDMDMSQSWISRLVRRIGKNILQFLKTISAVKLCAEKGLDDESIAKKLNLESGKKIKYYIDAYNYLYMDGPYVEITESWAKKPTYAESGLGIYADECAKEL